MQPWLRWLPWLPLLVLSVDRSKFRTCEQTAFCRRFRAYAKEVSSEAGTPVHSLSEVVLKEHRVFAQLLHRHGATHNLEQLTLELQFFRSMGSCGVVRVSFEQPSVETSRSVAHRSVVVDSLEADDIELQQLEDGALISSKHGPCAVRLRGRGFQLELLRDNRVLQTLNARQLLNYELPRSRDEQTVRSPGVDATDADPRSLWEESFDGFVDRKASGPSARGFDVSFGDSTALVGLAEHATSLHLGKFSEPYRLYNLDVFEYEVDVPMALYGSIPMVTCIHGSGAAPVASGLLALNPSEGFVQVDDMGNNTESGPLELYFFLGPSAPDVLRQYHSVTGRPRMPPLAALGKHQSRWNYITPEDVLEVSRNFDRHNLPLDFLWLDLEHTNGKRYFTWDPKHFALPEVGAMLDTLNRSHRKLVTIIDPHLFADPNYTVANLFKEKKLLIQKSSGEDFEGFCWPGPSVYPDFCSAEARAEWAKLFDFKAYPTGDGRPAEVYTWNDMNEPSVFDGPEITLPKDTLHRCDGKTLEHREVHNLYGFWVQEASVQGQLLRDAEQRPFVLTRSFFAGSHRHGAAWTGDNMANWRHLERSVPMLLSLSLCGLSLAGADVAGFMGDPDLELFVRWHQLGIWYPFYRAHAHLTSKRREPWLFGPAVLDKVRNAVLTRYRLLPMWYTLAAEWAMFGSPMIRPIWYHDLEDPQAFQYADSQFFVGESLLVRAPEVKYYLPGNSTWYDFWDGKPRFSGSYKEALHKQHLPVFVRSGHCSVQKWRPRRSTTAMMADPYTVVCYGPAAKGRVYIDDGRSHEYQKGAYIFDEVTLDSTSLRGSAWTAGAGNAGAPQPAVPATSGLQVERVVLLGASSVPKKITRGEEELKFHVESGEGGARITIRRPGVSFGATWSLHFH